MKSFIKATAQWLNHRLIQLVWKHWKRIKTRFIRLKRLGIEEEEAWKVANIRKGHWKVSHSETLIQWVLKDFNHLYERTYSNYSHLLDFSGLI